jgi:RNA polymerase sigma-70 factor (ECF subfamily)
MPPSNRSRSPADWVLDHGDALFRYAYLKLRDRDAAEDAVQETLLAALRARTSFSGDSSERTWLVGILKHKVSDHWRRMARTPLHEPPAGSDDHDEFLERAFDDTGHWRTPPSRWEDPDSALEDKQFPDRLPVWAAPGAGAGIQPVRIRRSGGRGGL